MGTRKISWDQVEAWDQRHSRHLFLTPEEVAFSSRCVERVEEHFICRSADLGNMSQWPNSAVYARMARKGVLAGGMVPNTLTTLVPSCSITRELIDMASDAVDDGLTAVDGMCDR